jgi:exodeoxyribonuclease-3
MVAKKKDKTMQIITWNVNGLRASINKGAVDWLVSQAPQVFCLQEIKSRPEQLSLEDIRKCWGYHAYWNPAEKPGYSGVATFTQSPPAVIGYGLGNPEFDREGRVICTRLADYLLFNIYFPNGQRNQGRLDYKLAFYARLLEICDRLHKLGENIILCGDFNTAHREIDLKNARQNAKNSGFLPEERVWIDKYIEHGLVDPFRHLYPDRIQYTWWTYLANARARNIGWRLDFFMVSERLMERVKDVIIHDSVPGSDHCPVSLLID